MRSRIAYVAVLLTGLTLIAVALQGLRGMDTSLQVAANRESPQQVVEPVWQPPRHGCDHHDV